MLVDYLKKTWKTSDWTYYFHELAQGSLHMQDFFFATPAGAGMTFHEWQHPLH